MENMSRVLLDAVDDVWSVVITHDDREVTCANFPNDIQLVQLHPHKTDNGVTLTMDGKTVGHLPADLAYFHRQVKRVTDSGLMMYAECKVEPLDGRDELVIPYISEKQLQAWALEKVRRYRHHLSEKRRLGKAPAQRITMQRVSA